MTEEIEMTLADAEEGMQKALDHLSSELTKIRAGRATPSMLDSVKVDYYGSPTPLGQVGNVNTIDSRTITVQPWEKGLLEEIAKGIMNANLGLNPQNNGEIIIVSVPVLTEERRKELVKKAKAEGESAKIGVRAKRKDANDFIKTMKNDGLSEDQAKGVEDSIQKLTDTFISKIDNLVDKKEIDIMKV
jgi:ribosome recycling factor